MVGLLKYLKDGLPAALLLLTCIVGLQINLLLAQAGGALDRLEGSVSSVLSSARETLDLSHRTLSTQQGYYRDSASHVKALTRAAAIDAVRLGRLIESSQRAVENTDARLGRVSSSAESSLDALRAAASAVAEQTESVGKKSGNLMDAGTEAVEKAGDLAANPSLESSLAHLEVSSENLQKTTEAAAQSMGYIRDMLSPTKKSFWRRLLEMMIPRPTVRVL
jgi:ABC-type transporter Mla subunit MlaD